jgi:uncharacterized zinc-type alcohol dehydrogenase-like protein
LVLAAAAVGVVGLGGLDYFAVLFVAALSASVTIISRSSSKKDDVIRMVAKSFFSSSNSG